MEQETAGLANVSIQQVQARVSSGCTDHKLSGGRKSVIQSQEMVHAVWSLR